MVDTIHFFKLSKNDFQQASKDKIQKIQNEQTNFNIIKDYFGKPLNQTMEKIGLKKSHKILKISKTQKSFLLKRLVFLNETFFVPTINEYIKKISDEKNTYLDKISEYEKELQFYVGIHHYFKDSELLVLKNQISNFVYGGNQLKKKVDDDKKDLIGGEKEDQKMISEVGSMDSFFNDFVKLREMVNSDDLEGGERKKASSKKGTKKEKVSKPTKEPKVAKEKKIETETVSSDKFLVYFEGEENMELFKEVISTWNRNKLQKKILEINNKININKQFLNLTLPTEASIDKNLTQFLDGIKTAHSYNEINAVIDFQYILIVTLSGMIKTINKNLEIHEKISKITNHYEPDKKVIDFFKKFLDNYRDQGELKKPLEAFPWIIEIVKQLMIILLLDNDQSLIQGSFVTHLINNKVKFSDIDLYHSDSFKFMLNIMLVIQLITGADLHIMKIPYIKNYLVVKDESNTNIVDCCHFSDSLIQSLPKLNYKSYNVIHPVCILVNMFRMLSVKERRIKINKDFDKSVLSYSTLFCYIIEELNINIQLFKKITIKEFLGMIKKNNNNNVIIDISKILPDYKYIQIYANTGKYTYEEISSRRAITTGRFSRSFGSLLDELFYEYTDSKNKKNLIFSFKSLESSLNEKQEIGFETLKAMIWTFCQFLFLTHDLENAKITFAFAFTISKIFNDSETISTILPREKNVGFHKEINYKKKLYYPIYSNEIDEKNWIPFSEFVLTNIS